MEEYKVPLL